MKNQFMFILAFFWTLLSIGAQNSLKPHSLVSESKKHIESVPVKLFSPSKNKGRSSIPSAISTYSLLQLDQKAIDKINLVKTPLISLSIPQEGRNDLTLELVEVFPFAPGFTIKTAPSMETINVNLGKHYRGIIKGQDKSIAAISIFEDEVMGFVSHPNASGNLVLGKLEGAEDHILYQDDQVAEFNTFECATKDHMIEYTDDEIRGNNNGTRALTDCVRLYLEVNYDIFVNKGSSANVTSFVTGIFNQVSTLYSSEQINTVISEMVIWTQTSPYTSTSSSNMLNQFTAYRQGFNGDIAQLLSYQASGGIAYVDGLCRSNTDYSMSYAGIQSTYQSVPTYSWTVEVCTHEFGHLFGSQHTHACVWNGNNTAIDGCYSVEGSCSNPGVPSSGGGTIMSYCHLTSTGINFSNGFGTQPGNVIRSKVTNASCLQACSGGGGGGGGGNPCTDNVLALQIRTDNYPGETTWDIRNASGTILYSGGPYSTPNTLNNIDLCLPTGCFNFTIYDSYGDGICCTYGSGYYNIKQGNTTLISGSQFASSETKNFCATGSNPTPTCTDGVQNGNETGIDCGGSCTACPTCTDGIQNGSETGIDCGGNCAACATCTDGIRNGGETGIDCGGPNCPACTSCNDGIQNGNETGIDCGGSCAACPTCTDGLKNGSETGIDCGGPNCSPCNSNGSTQTTTLAGHYFESGWDGWSDGGSDCSRVNIGAPEGSFTIQLRDNSGIASAMTSPQFNLSSFDSVTVEFKFSTTSFESSEDFRFLHFNGTTWNIIKSYINPNDFVNGTIYSKKIKLNGPLSASSQFRFQADASDNSDIVNIDAVIIKGYSTSNVGNPSCTDGIQNGNETGIDCGGSCNACPTCSDGILNNGETSIDCGGPNCAACTSCNDGIQNGGETGIDCGGSCNACPTCSDGIQNGNETGIDCGGNCNACPTCSDGIQNGSETGVDCGGSCPACPSGGSVTLSGHYFETTWDGWLDGGSDCARYLGTLSPEGQYSIRLRDNSADQSAMTSSVFDFSPYNAINVQFMFRAEGMENGEDFWLLYFDGMAWSTVAVFTAGTEFINGNLYNTTVTLNGSLSNISKLRFQSDASENDDNVYIDAVIITANTSSSIVEKSIQVIEKVEFHTSETIEQVKGVSIYPNPATDIVNIITSEEINQVNIYDLAGHLMLSTKSIKNVDISLLNSGMYIMRIESDDHVYTKKLVKN